MSTWVANASPLVFLAKLGRLDLLEQQGSRVLVPRAVIEEVLAKPDEAARAVAAACLTWLGVRVPSNRDLVAVLSGDLDLGEAEVIALAKETSADWVVMDDLAGRRLSRRLALRPIGTMGLLLAARLRGDIPSLSAEIEKLERLGFRATAALVSAVLREAQE